jgi:hypothetical protein
MTPASAQASLFDAPTQVDRSAAPPPARCPADGTRSVPSDPLDETASRLRDLVSALRRGPEPLDRIRVGLELRVLAEKVVSFAINDARHEGHTWRELGATLGVPFQTLFRRYGSIDPDASRPTPNNGDYGPNGSSAGEGNER